MNESVFISYARKDGAAAKKIVGGLRKAGFKILAVKSSTTDPAELKKELAAKISRADCVLALISPDAMKTKRWHSEVRFATKRDKLIVPVLLAGDKMPPELAEDVYPLEDIDGELADLVGYVKDLFAEDDGYDAEDDDDPFSELADDDDEGDSRLPSTPRKKAASGRSLWVAPGGGPSNVLLGFVVLILVVVVSAIGIMVMIEQSGTVTIPSNWTTHEAGNISVSAPPNWLSFDEQDLLSGNISGLEGFEIDPSAFAADMEDTTLEIALTDPKTGTTFMVMSGIMPEPMNFSDIEDEMSQGMEGLEELFEFAVEDIPAGESFKMSMSLEMFGAGVEMVLYATPKGNTLYMAIWMAAIGEEAPPKDMLEQIIHSYQIG